MSEKLTQRKFERVNRPQWELVGLKLVDGAPVYTPLTEKQQARVADYQQVLQVAADSDLAHPIYSGFHVQEAIGPIGKPKLNRNQLAENREYGEYEALHDMPAKKFPSGNLEYGKNKALHGEEFSVVMFEANYQNYDGDLVLAVITPGIASCCGNCRDILLDMLNGHPERLEIVNGTVDGGKAPVYSFKTMLFEDYMPYIPDKVTEAAIDLEIDLIKKRAKEYNPYAGQNDLYPERNYRAGIRSQVDFYPAAFHGFADFHPTYPLTRAILQAEVHDDIFINNVVILTKNEEGNPPNVMYADRQHLLEQNQIQEDILEREIDPPVFLVNETSQGRQIWRTSIKEWLPFPFSADKFGEDFRKYFADYNRNFLKR